MKKWILTLVALATLTGAMANDKKVSFKVNGYESKAKIEAAAQKVSGVKKATYTEKSKTLAVQYDDQKTTADKVKRAVLQVDRKPAAKKINANKSTVKVEKKSSDKKIVPQKKSDGKK